MWTLVCYMLKIVTCTWKTKNVLQLESWQELSLNLFCCLHVKLVLIIHPTRFTSLLLLCLTRICDTMSCCGDNSSSFMLLLAWLPLSVLVLLHVEKVKWLSVKQSVPLTCPWFPSSSHLLVLAPSSLSKAKLSVLKSVLSSLGNGSKDAYSASLSFNEPGAWLMAALVGQILTVHYSCSLWW